MAAEPGRNQDKQDAVAMAAHLFGSGDGEGGGEGGGGGAGGGAGGGGSNDKEKKLKSLRKVRALLAVHGQSKLFFL